MPAADFIFLLSVSTIPPPARPYRTLAVVCLGVGALLVLVSMCAAVAFLVIPILETDLFTGSTSPIENALATNTSVISLGAVALGYGLLLLRVGRSLQRESRRAAFQLPPPLFLLAAFFLVLVLGQAILTINVGAAYLFPPFHVLASLLFPLTVLAFAVRRVPSASLRSMLAQFSWGGLVTIALALVFELLLLVALSVLAFVIAVVLFGMERSQELASELLQSANSPSSAIEILTREPLLLLLAAGMAVLLFVVLVPLLEEILKATGPAILMARRERAKTGVTKSEALLWGLAAGAGYTFTENMFNSQGALTGSGGVVSFWAAAMILRSGTSLMHMVATATVATGWYHLFVHGRTQRAFQLLAAATAAHAVWNGGAVALGGVAALNGAGQNRELISTLLVVLVLIFLVALFGALLVWLTRLIHWAQPSSVEILTPQTLTNLGSSQVKEF